MELILPESKKILAAFSGGADSTAMLAKLWELKLKGMLELVAAAHFNHGLRPEAGSDEEHVRGFCGQRGLPCYFGGADVAQEAELSGRGVEETARELRYSFLQTAAERAGAQIICTAHNADDNVETVLLNLARGAGLTGLSGIPVQRGNIFRPMLHVTRAEILEYLNDAGLSYVEDASNRDTSFRRNRIRHDVVPVLREFNPRLAQAVRQTTTLVRQDESYLDEVTEKAMRHAEKTSGGVAYPVEGLKSLHPAIAVRVCRVMCRDAGLPSAQYEHLNAMLALAKGDSPSARIDLPRGMTARRQYDKLVVEPGGAPHCASDFEFECAVAEDADAGRGGGDIDTFLVNADAINGNLAVRSRQKGDCISLAGRGGTKTLKKLFIDGKVPRHLRENIPVVADDLGVIAVSGFGVDRSRVPAPGHPVLRLTVRSSLQ